MKIAIIGTRGIPNRYGGFEELAEHLSLGLLAKGHDVTVYNSSNHPWQKDEWNGVNIVHCKDPEHSLGTMGQFVYDLNCVKDAAKRHFDVTLFLGYTSISVWGKFFPKHCTIISNMDGLEWKRTKYSKAVQRFLRYAEKLAVKYSQYFIADSIIIQKYLEEKYKIKSEFIPYGAYIPDNQNENLLADHGLTPGNYFMLMARMEPENNIAMILQGFHNSKTEKKFIVIGNTDTKFGRQMLKQFSGDKRIRFAGAIYDTNILHSLKHFCSMYFHGHSVGGTNPSLLQAMASGALIAAHDNDFNKAVTGHDALYFNSAEDVQLLLKGGASDGVKSEMIQNNIEKIRLQYSWPAIIDQYERFISDCHKAKVA